MCTVFLFPLSHLHGGAAGYIFYTSMSFPVSILPSQNPAAEKLCCSCLRHMSHTNTSSLPVSLTVMRGWWPVRAQAYPSLLERPWSAGPCFVLFLCPHPWGRRLFQPGSTSWRPWHTFPAPSWGLSAVTAGGTVTVPAQWLSLGCCHAPEPCWFGVGGHDRVWVVQWLRANAGMPVGWQEMGNTLWSLGRFCPRATAAASAVNFLPWGMLPQGASNGQAVQIWEISHWIREYFMTTHVARNS